jgi:hypothetical protein
MKAFEPTPGTALHPGLQSLIERGILSQAASSETPEATTAFAAAVARAISRGEMTPRQASTLGQMLGVRAQA